MMDAVADVLSDLWIKLKYQMTVKRYLVTEVWCRRAHYYHRFYLQVGQIDPDVFREAWNNLSDFYWQEHGGIFDGDET